MAPAMHMRTVNILYGLPDVYVHVGELLAYTIPADAFAGDPQLYTVSTGCSGAI